jgi:hypothetical protein
MDNVRYGRMSIDLRDDADGVLMMSSGLSVVACVSPASDTVDT